MKRTFTHTWQRWLLERTGRLPTVPGLPAVPRLVPTEYHVGLIVLETWPIAYESYLIAFERICE